MGFRLGISVASLGVAGQTMLRLTPRRRVILSETLRDFANLTVGALALSRFVGEERWSLGLFLTGIAMWLVFAGLAVVVANGNGNR